MTKKKNVKNKFCFKKKNHLYKRSKKNYQDTFTFYNTTNQLAFYNIPFSSLKSMMIR